MSTVKSFKKVSNHWKSSEAPFEKKLVANSHFTDKTHIVPKEKLFHDSMQVYKFGPHLILETQVFFKSKLTLGVVNLKPIAPGHVLVIPKRNTPRLADLNKEETVDLMLSAQTIGRVVEKHYACTSLTMTIQDGPQAGQTVPHVHMHVIPRKRGDWANNDDVYQALDESKGVDNEDREPRTEEDMKQEADALRVYFESENL